jgi:glyoxylase-like metal-dependent hydrolase (beta-lactamase superfamily II)
MNRRVVLGLGCLAVVAAVGWLSVARPDPPKPTLWEQVTRGVYRTKAAPHTYAIVSEKSAVLIDATVPPDALRELGVEKVEAVLLTHHHRDATAFAADYRKAGIPVRAAKEAAEYLTPDGVKKFWAEAIPLRNSRTAYFVLPTGVEGVDCTLEDGKPFVFGEWNVTPVATPGHSRDHFAFRVRPADDVGGLELVFCGDAFCSPGKLWTPFTTDWDHWTEVGLKPTAESLRKLSALKPTHLCPAHGPVVTKDAAKALADTAALVEEAGFLKSFERFTDRLGNAPDYKFLVPKEQIASAGEKPWAQISDHLWITGNTYVLRSQESRAVLVLDPWGERSAKQVEKLLADQKLGPVEVIAFSHAHYDHFDGIHYIPARDRCEVWGLNLVAGPLKDPLRYRAPFLDPRPIKFTKELQDGETAAWDGYVFKFYHLPGQSWFTSGIETTIDGKHCVFTADNFFHQRQFSGSGGWMGLNRSSPVPYGKSAQKVLDIRPEWVLAEHGGPYVFDAEDYRRRVQWGEAAGKACDALCVSGDHLRDWTPHLLSVEPVLVTAKPGAEVSVTVRVTAGREPVTVWVSLAGQPGFVMTAKPGQDATRPLTFRVPEGTPPGRHVFSAWAAPSADRASEQLTDSYLAVDVPAP